MLHADAPTRQQSPGDGRVASLTMAWRIQPQHHRRGSCSGGPIQLSFEIARCEWVDDTVDREQADFGAQRRPRSAVGYLGCLRCDRSDAGTQREQRGERDECQRALRTPGLGACRRKGINVPRGSSIRRIRRSPATTGAEIQGCRDDSRVAVSCHVL